MQGTLVTIKSDGAVRAEHVSRPVLAQLQAAVGGYIQVIPGFEHYDGKECVAFCNEEGKLDGLPPNEWAQALWRKYAPQYAQQDQLVGDIVIAYGDDEFMTTAL